MLLHPDTPNYRLTVSRLEIFDEYTRRQFVAKAPNRNPFGTEEEPNKFNDFDIFTKIRVLQQLSTWTLNNPNTIREKLALSENEQTLWVSMYASQSRTMANHPSSAWSLLDGTQRIGPSLY